MTDLTDFALEGYDAADGAEPAYTHGSNAYIAWKVGKWLRDQGNTRPTKVMPDDGYSVRVDGAKVVIASAAYGEPRFVDA